MAILISNGELPYEAYLGQEQDEGIPATTCQILEMYKEALTGFSHIYHAVVLNATSLSQGYLLGEPLGVRKASRTHIPRMGAQVPRSSSQVNRQSRLFDDISQHYISPCWVMTGIYENPSWLYETIENETQLKEGDSSRQTHEQ